MKEWITGRNPVYECLRAGRRHFFRLWIKKGAVSKGRIAEIKEIAKRKQLLVKYVENNTLYNLSEHHQGVALEVSEYPYSDLSTIKRRYKESREPLFFLILDQIQDVHNLGSLLRTAEIMGVHGAILPLRRAAGITPAVVNASSGACEHLLIAQRNINQTIDELKETGVWVVGLDVDDSAEPLEHIDLRGPLALIVGSEENGLRKRVQEKCDHIVFIPMRGKIESLNAAVAGSIALYQAALARMKNS